MSVEGVLAGGAESRFWEIEVAETGRGSWVGLVEVQAGEEDGGSGEKGDGGGSRQRWPDGDLSLSAIGWGIWGGETGDFHPMYIKGKTVDQIVAFKAGQTVGLHLRPVGEGWGGAVGGEHALAYLIDGREVCEAFLPDELPQGRKSSLHLAISNGWAGTTRAVAREVPPMCKWVV
jgi:hypothetical protein